MKYKINHLLSVLLVIISQCLNAQTEVGQHIDLDGNIIEGYFDQITYSPKNSILTIHNSTSYESGYYRDSQGNKDEGYILFENDKIYFKKEGGLQYRVKPSEATNIVLGVDSFFVISNFYFRNRLKKQPEFVQYITELNGYKFAKHYHFTSGVGQHYGRAPIIETYLIKAENDSVWDNFPDNESLKSKALKYFGHIPELEHKIRFTKFEHKDIEGLIKMAEYYDKYKKSLPIFFDRYWQETKDIHRKVYTAKLVEISDHIWTMEYYKGEVKLYSIQYTSFAPFVKNGLFSAFYSNGNLRQTTLYSKNKAKEVKTYTKNGELTKHYKYTKTQSPNIYYDHKAVKYLTINQPLLKYKTNNMKLDQQYNDYALTQSYYKKGPNTIHQITDPNYIINIKKIEKKMGLFLFLNSFEEAIKDNAQGTVLISFVMDPKGYIVNATSLNKLHPEIDDLLTRFVREEILKTSRYNIRLKPFKIDRTKHFCEFVIPFEFGINRFYRQPLYYDYNHHWLHIQQMQMNQIMNTMP